MKIFALPGNTVLARGISRHLDAELGIFTVHRFPDGESYVRLLCEVKEQQTVIVCTLFQPDDKILPLYYLTKLLKDSGAKSVTLIAPYLAYMRQDKVFNPGEAVTSNYFAALLSSFVDRLITIDPHLHRHGSMSELYAIPCKAIHAAPLVSDWIRQNVVNPIIIGPDSESEQWVSKVAAAAESPFLVLEKVRHSDHEVEVSKPAVAAYHGRTPVLVDDIISTAHTMIETVGHLHVSGMVAPVCIGVHPVFAGNAYDDLVVAGAAQVISCNTIQHPSNRIDVAGLLATAISE
ncbi:MAG: ribose-phosphate pyrophosphokinase [Chitinophagales bacterium]|nr:ribose-phosphate pyrophosphokinase [Chitinophagales bacterium]